MLLSFILVIQYDKEDYLSTIRSIESQTNKDYEIIVTIDDSFNKEFSSFFLDYFEKNKNVKVIINSTIQGTSVSWNGGLDIAEGKYITFVKSGDTLATNFVETIANAIKNKGEIDLIEFKMNLVNLADSSTKTYVELDKVYNLHNENIPFAYINDLIFNKCFKTSLINEWLLKFRRFVRYDMLFIFKFLSQSETYIHINSEALVNCQIDQVQYSAFDIVNQWPHILNYYRRVGKYKELKDQLNYAFYKVMIHTWIWSVKRYNNKILIKKAANFISRKFGEKKDEFIKENKIFALKKDEKFTSIVDNFDKYIKDILKLTK